MNEYEKDGDRNSGCIRAGVDSYLDWLRRLKYSPKTLSTYGWALGDFSRFLEDAGIAGLQDVTTRDIESYRLKIRERGFKSQSVEVYIRAVRQFFGYLEEHQWILINPAERLVVRTERRPLQQVPSEEDIGRILSQPDVSTPIGMRDRAMLELAYSSGARRAELIGIQVNALDLTSGTVRLLGKGNRERVVPIGDESCRSVQLYLEQGRPKLLGSGSSRALWISAHGRDLQYPAVNSIVHKYAKLAGATISAHGFRRACATHMLRHGAHPVQVQQLLGHASMRHLSQYLSLTITELKEAHAASKPGS